MLSNGDERGGTLLARLCQGTSRAAALGDIGLTRCEMRLIVADSVFVATDTDGILAESLEDDDE
jgi:hypothetical protein